MGQDVGRGKMGQSLTEFPGVCSNLCFVSPLPGAKRLHLPSSSFTVSPPSSQTLSASPPTPLTSTNHRFVARGALPDHTAFKTLVW